MRSWRCLGRGALAVSVVLAVVLATSPAAATTGCPDVYGNPVVPPGELITASTSLRFRCGEDGVWHPLDRAEPALIAAAPTSGATAGGTHLLLVGAWLQPGLRVWFGDAEGTDVTFLSPSAVMATTPPGRAGPIAIIIVNPDGGQVTLADAFHYVAPPLPPATPPRPTHRPLWARAWLAIQHLLGLVRGLGGWWFLGVLVPARATRHHRVWAAPSRGQGGRSGRPVRIVRVASHAQLPVLPILGMDIAVAGPDPHPAGPGESAIWFLQVQAAGEIDVLGPRRGLIARIRPGGRVELEGGAYRVEW